MNTQGEFKDNSNQRFSQEATEWRNKVFKRDNYACIECGGKGKIQAHHIKEWAKNKELRFDVDNGITLCIDCHCKRHPERANLIRRSRRYSGKE